MKKENVKLLAVFVLIFIGLGVKNANASTIIEILNVPPCPTYTLSTAYPNERRAARSSDGALHCIYVRYADANYRGRYYGKSTDNGQTWPTEELRFY